MSACEYGLEALAQAQKQAIEASTNGQTVVRVIVQCANPKGCSMTFSASANKGKLTGGGIEAGEACKETGGMPN